VLYLLSAGNTCRRDDCVLRLGPDGREEAELADAHGQFVVLHLEAERAGHAAAPGVNFDDVGTRDAAKQGHRRRGTRDRLLMAVAVEQDATADIILRQGEPAGGDGLEEQFLGQSRGGCHGLRPHVAGQKGRVLVAQSQQA
jgi:hypothetical protein